MLGGYQILDLRNIDLSRSTSEADITDSYAFSQLLNIRDHIQKTYDFSKPLHNQLKPLLIRYRDKKVGEKHEVALYGNIEVINTYYKFRIIANNEGEQLTINVEFEEKTDEYSNKYWSIKTAKVLLTSAEQTIANILASGNVNNAKPLYFHPIILVDIANRLAISCIIIDNNSNSYNTYELFKEKVISIATGIQETARIVMSGSIHTGDNTKGLKIATSMDVTTDGILKVFGYNQDGSYDSITITNLNITSVFDGVNKIN